MPIIKNYGFLWERQFIYRGRGNSAGHLEGRASGQNNADFREQIGVYALYDSNQKITYVGQAGNGNATLFGRLKQHMDGPLRKRWDYFTWFGFRDVNADGTLSKQQKIKARVSGFNYSQALDQMEGILIEVIEPTLNKQSGKLNNAKEYLQIIDDRYSSITNSEILQEIQSLKAQIESLR